MTTVTRRIWTMLVTASFACLLAGPVLAYGIAARLAGPFTETYFFGDSLTDTGNVAERLPLSEIPQALPGQPDSFYWNGRFSNGPNWADRFAMALGTSSKASAQGGPNYAAGGAHNVRPNPDPAFQVLFDREGWLLSEQIDAFLSDHPEADPDALYTIFMGSNDAGVGGATDPLDGIAEVIEAVERLHAAGAKRFLVWGLFPFVVPPFPGIESYALGFNESLPGALADAESRLPDSSITFGDNVSAIGPILDDPATFGFSNAGGFFEPTGCTVLGFPAPPVGGNADCEREAITDTFFGRPIGDTYLFHDGIHFTTAVQKYWTDYAIIALCRDRLEERFSGRYGKVLGNYFCHR